MGEGAVGGFSVERGSIEGFFGGGASVIWRVWRYFEHRYTRYEYLKGLTLVRLHSNEGGSCTQVCKTGHIGPGRPQRDLPRTAAMKRLSEHLKLGPLTRRLCGDMYRTCTSVSPFFW